MQDGTYTLIDHGMNWNWYCHVQVENNVVTILGETRFHLYSGPRHPKTTGRYEMVENKTTGVHDPRMILAIRIDYEEYQLANAPIPRWGIPPMDWSKLVDPE